MITYLAKSFRQESITEPLNKGIIRYYSVMNDGSSSAKTHDEKELFLMKTAADGIPKFSIMSLEEPDDADAEGLKVAMDKSFEKLALTINRRDHEIGMCADGAAVNFVLYELVKAEIGEHYLDMWCPRFRT